MAGRVVFSLIKTVSISELNNILDEQRSKFIANEKPGSNYVLPIKSTANNAVEVYRVNYLSEIPEKPGRRISATGMLALPVLSGTKKAIPLIAYQHGTVFGKNQVPSLSFVKDENLPNQYPHYESSYETRYMVGLFAGNGYALMAADYYGLGGSSNSPEAYFVKGSTQQANYDLYLGVSEFLTHRGTPHRELFLGGWSQGALNTTGFLEKLESSGVKVSGTFTAANPSDPFAAFNGLLYHPRVGLDAPWTCTLLALSVFSYENYYGKKDLGREVINPKYYSALKSIYNRSYGDPENLSKFLVDNASVPLVQFFRQEYQNPAYLAKSSYGKLLAANETYRQEFKSPTVTYYGTVDEVIQVGIGQLASLYQGILSDESKVRAQQVDGATHRLTFINAAADSKMWMDALLAH